MNVKYKRIYQAIKEKIRDGSYPSGQQIPDEYTLCETYDASRMTVKRALQLLAEEGLLYPIQGRGTFVCTAHAFSGRRVVSEAHMTGFTASAKGDIHTDVLRLDLHLAGADLARYLGIHEEDPVYDIIRVRSIDGKPHVWEHNYVPSNIIRGITKEVLEGSFYRYIEEDLGLKIAGAKRYVRADRSRSEDHQFLALHKEEPVLEVEQVEFLEDGTAFEYSLSRHRYDLYEFVSFSKTKR